jgi:hypothetical protein
VCAYHMGGRRGERFWPDLPLARMRGCTRDGYTTLGTDCQPVRGEPRWGYNNRGFKGLNGPYPTLSHKNPPRRRRVVGVGGLGVGLVLNCGVYSVGIQWGIQSVFSRYSVGYSVGIQWGIQSGIISAQEGA